MSLFVAYPLHWTYLAVYPLNWALNRASGMVLRAMGVEEAGHAEVFSGEEIKGLVATSREHGEIADNQADMLHNLFEFDQRLVGRVMIPVGSVKVLDISGEHARNLEIIRESGHSRFPVIDSARDDAIAGILLVKDIHAAMLGGEERPWEDLARFLREPLIVPETQRVAELFDLMRQKRAHMAFVVDEYGQMSGVVTLEDLLEEIVGEIHDETDDVEDQLPITRLDERRWEADGLLSLTDLARETGCQVADELDANTLSGLFMARLARMPEKGDAIEEGCCRFTVVSLQERRVGKVAVEQLAETDPDAGEPHPEQQ
jgi:CBS domain containing-hemolysin-like protein